MVGNVREGEGVREWATIVVGAPCQETVGGAGRMEGSAADASSDRVRRVHLAFSEPLAYRALERSDPVVRGSPLAGITLARGVGGWIDLPGEHKQHARAHGSEYRWRDHSGSGPPEGRRCSTRVQRRHLAFSEPLAYRALER